MMDWFHGQQVALQRWSQLRGFWRQRTVFYRDTATAIESNEALPSYLEGELQIARAPKTADPDRAKGFAYAHEMQQNNDFDLGSLLNALMPKSDSLALSALQKAKNIPKALNDLAFNIEQQQAMTALIRKSLITPIFVVAVAFALAYLFASQFIPSLEKAATPEVWESLFNNSVRYVARFVHAYGPWLFGLLLASLICSFVWALPNLTANWRYSMESSRGWKRFFWTLVFPLQPLFALYRDIQGANMLGSLANLMQGGAEFKDALGILAQNAQPWMRKHLMIILSHLDVSEGDYVTAFSHGVLPTFLVARMGSLMRREAGHLDKVLIHLGVTGSDKSREQVHKNALILSAWLILGGVSVTVFFYLGQGAIIASIREQMTPSAMTKRQIKKEQQGANPVEQPGSRSLGLEK